MSTVSDGTKWTVFKGLLLFAFIDYIGFIIYKFFLIGVMSNAEKVYHAVKCIPKGKVSTYGRIAESIGVPKAARMVGQMLHKNPDPQTISCHRVVFSDGSLSENFAFGGIKRQA